MVKQIGKIDITKSIKSELECLENNLDKIKFLEDKKKKWRNELNKKKYNKISNFYIKRDTPLESKERLLSVKHTILLQRVKWATNQIARLKREEKHIQIEWLGKEEQLQNFVKFLIDRKYLDNSFGQAFRDLFFIKSINIKAKKISHTINWENKNVSLLYLLYKLNEGITDKPPLLVFKNSWTWIDKIFVSKKHVPFKGSATIFNQTDFEKIKDKKTLDRIIKNIYGDSIPTSSQKQSSSTKSTKS